MNLEEQIKKCMEVMTGKETLIFISGLMQIPSVRTIIDEYDYDLDTMIKTIMEESATRWPLVSARLMMSLTVRQAAERYTYTPSFLNRMEHGSADSGEYAESLSKDLQAVYFGDTVAEPYSTVVQ